jgi:APA family basic amino acid/polyamine antiporter
LINQKLNPKPVLGLFSAMAIVVASMIGTGIFTTTGFLVADLNAVIPVLIIWLVGGFLALCGAWAYGELSAAIPRSGGEYHFLSRIYHPLLGFLAGWISLIVGFSAPIAAAAIAFGKYSAAVLPSFPTQAGAVGLIILLSIAHITDVKLGSYIQNFFTVLKVALICIFIVGGLLQVPAVPLQMTSPNWRVMLSPAFATGLIFVFFAYSGWNGATYIINEVKQPRKIIPLALFFGTALVMLLYLLMNLIFLRAVPLSELSGTVEVGHLAATKLFGIATGKLISSLIAIVLVSSVSAMIMTGPRVYHTIGQDFLLFKKLSGESTRGTPLIAISLQALIAIVMVITASFDILLNYIGFTLSISTGLTVAGVILLRNREPDLKRPYHTWGYPVTPILFILLSLWMVMHNLLIRPLESITGIITIGAGIIIYIIANRSKIASNNKN